MFETRIAKDGRLAADAEAALFPVHAMLAQLAAFTGSGDSAKAGFSPSLPIRYAAASPIARRRFDAILNEAETIGTTGLKLIAGRSGTPDAATAAAARFLGNSLVGALRRLDGMLPAVAG